jgi:hypothetical protein
MALGLFDEAGIFASERMTGHWLSAAHGSKHIWAFRFNAPRKSTFLLNSHRWYCWQRYRSCWYLLQIDHTIWLPWHTLPKTHISTTHSAQWQTMSEALLSSSAFICHRSVATAMQTRSRLRLLPIGLIMALSVISSTLLSVSSHSLPLRTTPTKVIQPVRKSKLARLNRYWADRMSGWTRV